MPPDRIVSFAAGDAERLVGMFSDVTSLLERVKALEKDINSHVNTILVGHLKRIQGLEEAGRHLDKFEERLEKLDDEIAAVGNEMHGRLLSLGLRLDAIEARPKVDVVASATSEPERSCITCGHYNEKRWTHCPGPDKSQWVRAEAPALPPMPPESKVFEKDVLGDWWFVWPGGHKTRVLEADGIVRQHIAAVAIEEWQMLWQAGGIRLENAEQGQWRAWRDQAPEEAAP